MHLFNSLFDFSIDEKAFEKYRNEIKNRIVHSAWFSPGLKLVGIMQILKKLLGQNITTLKT